MAESPKEAMISLKPIVVYNLHFEEMFKNFGKFDDKIVSFKIKEKFDGIMEDYYLKRRAHITHCTIILSFKLYEFLDAKFEINSIFEFFVLTCKYIADTLVEQQKQSREIEIKKYRTFLIRCIDYLVSNFFLEKKNTKDEMFEKPYDFSNFFEKIFICVKEIHMKDAVHALFTHYQHLDLNEQSSIHQFILDVTRQTVEFNKEDNNPPLPSTTSIDYIMPNDNNLISTIF